MSITDVIVIGLVGILLVLGFFKGFIKQIFSLGSLIIAVIVAFFLVKPISGIIFEGEDLTTPNMIVVFLGIALVAFILLKIIGHMLGGGIHKSSIGIIDRLLGAAFGAAKGLIIVSLLFLVYGVLIKIPFVGNMIEDKVTEDIDVSRNGYKIGAYVYDNNFITLIIDKLK